MTISAISPSVNQPAAVQPLKQTASAQVAGNDKDKDDGASQAAAVQAAPRPTVNTSGQVVGSHINTQA